MYRFGFIDICIEVFLRFPKYRKSERFLDQSSVRYTLAVKGEELSEFADSDEIDNFPYLP